MLNTTKTIEEIIQLIYNYNWTSYKTIRMENWVALTVF